jgi:K+-transporting ATPase ATPase C chain
MISHARAALVLLLAFTLLTGILYPYAVTGLAQLVFPAAAHGSVVFRDGKAVGSRLIGQHFDSPRYFWGRLSATAPVPYNAAASSGSNYGPMNPALHDAAHARIAALRRADSTCTLPIPIDLVTASASGLDPHISVAAALYQARRVAKERHIADSEVRILIDRHTENRDLGVLGEAGVNVLALNLALDAGFPASKGGH